MKNKTFRQLIFVKLIITAFGMLLFNSCAKDEDTEMLQPKAEIISPMACDTIYFDEVYKYSFKIKDPGDAGLGSLSMDIHHNFNHHAHGDHFSCEMDPIKEPFYPYENVWIFSLPDDRSEYLFETEITIPSKVQGKENSYHDYGDYHYHIYITNNQGYQTFFTLDLKLLYRDGHPNDPWQ